MLTFEAKIELSPIVTLSATRQVNVYPIITSFPIFKLGHPSSLKRK